MNNASLFLFIAVFAIPYIIFLITQQNTLKAIQPQNRLMEPGKVWLQLIPLFGFIWQFFVVARIAGSLQKELVAQGTFSFEIAHEVEKKIYNIDKKPTYNIGITYCILFSCSLIVFIPFLSGFIFLAGIICWIIYWTQLAEVKKQIRHK